MKLFEATGKPVIGQVFGLPYIYGIYGNGSTVWFVDYLNNLYKHSNQNNKTEHIGTIHAENNEAIVGIAENNGKLYFAPYRNNKISAFDIEKDFEQINFKDDSKFNLKFQNVVNFKNFIYFIPSEFPTVMRLNTNTNEIEYFSEWVDIILKLRISKLQEEAWKNIIFFYSCVIESEIAMVIHGANAIMFFNMETGNYEIKNIGEKSEQYSSICFDGQNYYLSTFYENYIIKWNRQLNKTSKIKLPASFTRKTNKICNFFIHYSNKHIWLLPYAANNAYKINADTYEFTELHELVEHFENKNIDWFYNNVFVDENFIYASTKYKGIMKYNINTKELSFINDFDDGMMALLAIHGTEKSVAENRNAGKTIWEYFK